MMLRTLITVAMLSAAARPAHAQEAPTSAVRRDVEALLADMMTTFRTDPTAVKKYYTDDAVIVGGGARYAGREQVDQYWRGATMFADWTLEMLDVGDGPRPWVRGRSTLLGRSGRTMVTEFIGLLDRGADGKLRFQVDMFVASRAP